MPEPSLGGDFVMSPNARPLHQSYIMSAAQKALYDTRFMQKRLKRLVRDGRTAQLPMKIGQGYLFVGHTSLHANERCIGKQRRFTVIFHFGDPHEVSKVRKLGTLMSRRYHAVMNALKP
jgi:hypothetical protein